MKKRVFVAIMVMLLSCLTFCMCLTSVSAEEKVVSKTDFSKKAQAEVGSEVLALSEMSYELGMNRDDLYFYIVNNYPANTEEMLNKAGFFTYSKGKGYSQAISKDNVQTYGLVNSNSPQDVELTAPTITYDAVKNEWKVTAKGKWKNDNWKTSDLGTQWNGYGKTARLGDNDLYGFEFSNTTGNYDDLGVHIKSASVTCNPVTIYKKQGGNYVYNSTYQEKGSSIHAISGENGVLMQVKDELVITHSDWFWYQYSYGADTFEVVVNYSEEFASFHGYVSTFMHHNYSNAKIDNVSISKDAFEIKLSNENYGWEAYSGGQTKF